MKAFKFEKIKKALVLGVVGSVIMGSGAFAYMGHPGPNPNAKYLVNSSVNYTGQMGYGQGMGHMGMNMRQQGQIGQDDIVQQSTLQYVKELPAKPLDEQEKEGILHMREEEKLARDVYLTLYDKWGLPIFKNIARSEQNHMNAMKILIDKYNLTDPVEEVNDEVGKFVNPEIQELYNKLVEEGSKSVVDALKVGATIEDLDIKDLEEYASETDNDDIKTIYNNLMKGSRNHLRAFTSQLERYGETYQCQYLSQEECESIINSDWERGISYGPDNKPLFNGTPMYHNRGQMGYGQGMGPQMGQGQGMGHMGMNMRQQGQMGYGHRINIEMLKQNKEQFKERIMQREKVIKQQVVQVKEKVMKEIKTRKRLDPQTKEEVINLIKQMLSLKLESLLLKVVDTPLEDKYAQEIQKLLDEVDNANDVNSLKNLVFEYIKLKKEITTQLNNQ